MKIKTYFKIYYQHRLNKANFFLKAYLYLIIPFKYLINVPYLKKKINLDNFSKKNNFLYEKNLNYLFEYFSSDKGEKFINQYDQPIKRNSNLKIIGHDYAKFYEKIFNKLKNKKINILEIGSFYGNAAAAIFFYLENAKIFSADIFPDLFSYKSQRINNFYVDSSDETSIQKNIINLKKNFEIIIEDASHSYKDQIISLFMLFPLINSGGFFIIEELDFPDTRDDMNLNKEKPTLRDILLNIKNGNDFNNSLITSEQKKYFLKNVENISILKGNFNEIAIISKK